MEHFPSMPWSPATMSASLQTGAWLSHRTSREADCPPTPAPGARACSFPVPNTRRPVSGGFSSPGALAPNHSAGAHHLARPWRTCSGVKCPRDDLDPKRVACSAPAYASVLGGSSSCAVGERRSASASAKLERAPTIVEANEASRNAASRLSSIGAALSIA